MLVSSGPEPVRVPDLTGQSLSAAEATLANAGLAVGTVTQQRLEHGVAGHRALAVSRKRHHRCTPAARST